MKNSKFWRYSLLSAVLIIGCAVCADDIFECEFKPGKWNKADFIEVKSSRWPNINVFRQEKDHIVNVCPADATPQEMLGKRAAETYAALLCKKPLSGNCEIKAEMSFDYRMAPSIVIAEKPGTAANGHPEFRTHYEIVLFDQGINVWRHWFKDGKQVWRKVGYLNARFLPNVKYEMEVDIKFTGRGPVMEVSVGDKKFGFIDDLLPREYYAGIIACEGINRFYEFEIDK
ncbi:MAG: hypothetical protein E7052_05250 [Lentisphaerae bacterium]|nr:hypothetical protein [Lentisphaerota bacterium]